jgi:hypothetical protein
MIDPQPPEADAGPPRALTAAEADARIVIDDVWETEGGRYGHRAYQWPDLTGWDEYWGTRIEDWGTRVFATFGEAERWANARP